MTEIILIDDDIRQLIHEGAKQELIMAAARKKGTLTLLESGLKRVEEGITSLEEVLTVVIV